MWGDTVPWRPRELSRKSVLLLVKVSGEHACRQRPERRGQMAAPQPLAEEGWWPHTPFTCTLLVLSALEFCQVPRACFYFCTVGKWGTLPRQTWGRATFRQREMAAADL